MSTPRTGRLVGVTALLILSVVVMGVAFTGGAAAESITVDDDGSGDYDTIQDAVDNASSGDTIEVSAGTYDESVTIDVKNLTIEGPNAGIDGDSDQRDAEANITGQLYIT